MILTQIQAINLLLEFKKTVAKGGLLTGSLQQLIGLSTILALSKVGANGIIANNQNKMFEYGQQIQDFFGTTKLLKEHIYLRARSVGYTEKEANAQAEKYVNFKITGTDVDIFEVAAFQAVFVGIKYGKAAGVGAFIATELALNLRKMQAEKNGEYFNLAKSVRQLFPGIPGLSKIARFLEKDEEFEVAGGKLGFHLRDEEFEAEYEGFEEPANMKEILDSIPDSNGSFVGYNVFDNFELKNEGYTVFDDKALEGMKKQMELQTLLDSLKTDKMTEIIRTDIPDGSGEYIYDPSVF